MTAGCRKDMEQKEQSREPKPAPPRRPRDLNHADRRTPSQDAARTVRPGLIRNDGGRVGFNQKSSAIAAGGLSTGRVVAAH